MQTPLHKGACVNTDKVVSHRKLFLVGVGRSGTSLLQAMLASNEEITFLPETGFFRRYVMAGRKADSSKASIAREIKTDPRLTRIKCLADVANKFDWQQKNARQEFYETLFSLCQESSIVGDKDPRCIEFISPIASTWETAKIIHLLRDPRDVICSKKKADWSKGRNLFFYLVAGQSQLLLAARAHTRFAPSRICTVKYETLIKDTEKTLRSLCRWLDLEFQVAMLDFNIAAKDLVAQDEMQWKKETLGPLLKDNSEKWRSELTPFEIATIESSCTEAMRLGSYEEANGLTLGTFLKLWSKCIALLARFVAYVYVVKREYHNQQFIDQQDG